MIDIDDMDVDTDAGKQLVGSAVPGWGAVEKRKLEKVFRQKWACVMNFSASESHLFNRYLIILNTLLCARH